ncbi:bacterial type II and III secretion system family protein [Chlamydia ibidis]|uniref:Bacterial type II and III secretion system family protein n=2 Tax=Chlamydia ibidis TaxID=1405396 RepID=S7KEA6_9CHLA|nr:type II secretion system protein GspD [Chlamydia ibidis]EPP34541.1 bacterial type II and III secretion system family protein [Chlamydia ibidis]EQM62287.1 bacterial type II and III secretion system family protein [Chlamydia ibidis 10-1398/6]
MQVLRNPLVYYLGLTSLVWWNTGLALTVSEKTASLEKKGDWVSSSLGLSRFNLDIKELNLELRQLYEEAATLRESGCEDEETWKRVLDSLTRVKRELKQLEELWAAEIYEQGGSIDEYALWHHPETTVYNLVSDYGREDVVYLIPSHIGAIKVSSLSRFVVPKEAFEECLKQVLSRLGVGIREVSPWLKELYSHQKEGAGVAGVFASKKDLELLSPSAYIGYVVTSKNVDVRGDQQALKKFANSETVQIDIIGGKIWLFGSAGEISELLKIYDFIQSDSIRQEYRVVPLTKIDANEMVSILKAAFRDDITKDGDDSSLGFKVVPLQLHGRSLFLSGSSSLVQQAINLIKDIEEGIENPTDKTVFWYSVKHSDPQELAVLLSQVHDVFAGKGSSKDIHPDVEGATICPAIHIDTTAGVSIKEGSAKYGSFIADSKTGTLIVVVEKEALPRIKMLLKKLDVPKKMVRIEVLLFERKLAYQRKAGLNLLRLGEELCKKGSAALSFKAGGILEFLLQGNTGNSLVPGYDLAYQFLMAQEDIRINASPSVVTMNQTPARIAIVDEMSIAVSADNDKLQYNRAQYGIMIKLLPVINVGEEDGKSFITLETDITFDTTGKNINDRPDVTRRNITNKVRIADGETIIIGGLRCKQATDGQDGIPFLGEIPGVGKLFGMNSTSDSQTEMFVFITPKILDNPIEKKEKLAEALLASRPGECEEFQKAVMVGRATADANQKKLEFISSIDLPSSRTEGLEYDGR